MFNWDDIRSHQVSLLLVEPRAHFVSLFYSHMARKGWSEYHLYHPEQNTALLIPCVDSFVKSGSLTAFLNELKPRLLEVELERFRIHPTEFESPITNETFDEYFVLSVRDSILLMSDIGL